MTRMTWALVIFLLTMVLGLTPGPLIPLMASCALAGSLNAKPGAWEITSTTLMSGMPIPPDALGRCRRNSAQSSKQPCRDVQENPRHTPTQAA